MGRDMALAAAFGVSPLISSFMVAFRLAHLGRRMFGEGAMPSALVPTFERLRKNSEEEGRNFFSALYLTLTLFLTLLSFLTALVFFSASSFFPESSITLRLSALMMPSLIFICLSSLNTTYLQCEREYWTPSVAPALFNLVWIIGIVSAWSLDSHSMMILALSINLAAFVQWLFTFPVLYLYLRFSLKGFSLLKPFLIPFGSALLGVTASQINSAIDPLFAQYASLDGPATLWYAIRIQQLPLALFGVALSSALLPPLCRSIEQNESEKRDHLLHYTFNKTLKLMLIFSSLFFIFGKEGIYVLFERGDFQGTAALATQGALNGYTLGLIPMAAILILSPLFFALKQNEISVKGSFLSLFMNLLLNAMFIFGFGWGSESVAYATSLSAWIQFFYLKAHLPFSIKIEGKPLIWLVGASFLSFFLHKGLLSAQTEFIFVVLTSLLTSSPLLAALALEMKDSK